VDAFLEIFLNPDYRSKRGDWPEERGSRAEKRRERKKRDIPSPAKVL